MAALAKATRDDYRLVRIRAAASLSGAHTGLLKASDQASVRAATGELLASYRSRPDDFTNNTNLGNFYFDHGEAKKAVEAYEAALRLRPDSVATLVNASVAYGRLGRTADAERVLRRALQLAPRNGPANFNFGLLLAGTGRLQEAEGALRQALASDPALDGAAYNLCVLLKEQQRSDALSFCRQAAQAAPQVEKYAFSLAFYLNQDGDINEALRVLTSFAGRQNLAIDTRLLLAELLAKSGKRSQAMAMYRSALNVADLDKSKRRFIEARMQAR
jgi:Tfp pilus assembly protein PilF